MTNTYSGTNGALAAAKFAGTRRQRTLGDSYDGATLNTGQEGPPTAIRRSPINGGSRRAFSSSVETLELPKGSPRTREQSPSHIAAALAAARSAPGQVDVVPLRIASRQRPPLPRNNTDLRPETHNTDSTPIAATNLLVQLFESKNPAKPSKPEMRMRHVAKSPYVAEAPTSTRPPLSSRATLPSPKPLADMGASDLPEKLPGLPASVNPAFWGVIESEANVLKSATLASTSGLQLSGHRRKNPPEPPPPRKSSLISRPPLSTTISAYSFTKDPENISSSSSYASANGSIIEEPHPDERSLESAAQEKISEADTPQAIRASSRSFSRGFEPRLLRPSPNDASQRRGLPRTAKLSQDVVLPSTFPQPQLTVDSLANAIVASSIASSRAPSPTKSTPTLSRHHSKPYSMFHRNHSQDQINSRTSSPVKGMRHTMRGPPRSDNESERKKESGLIKKHPHKHHEGERKRWRDQVTEHERKRYEGVWAANKGMFLPSSRPEHEVLNIVVRDIWCRSRLPNDVLEEVWDLVDNEDVGTLSKEEFVVGMWLIDQRLKGRKLPVKVSESVWSSVRRLSGIKIPKNRR